MEKNNRLWDPAIVDIILEIMTGSMKMTYFSNTLIEEYYKTKNK